MMLAFSLILLVPLLWLSSAQLVVPADVVAGTSDLNLFAPFERSLVCFPDEAPPISAAEPEQATQSESEEEALAEFLSFEEWKARQIAQGVPPDTPHPSASPDSPPSSYDLLLSPPSPLPNAAPLPATPPLHLLIPLTDRYNYASDDCSARIHASSPGARNPSAILSAKKDRYMLFQCSAAQKWVDLELCDHVWVDTIQLANYEFFSGVFRSFSLFVADRYPPGPDGWVLAGTFEARNVRAVQSFHPAPEAARGFWRFVRIEFESFWGAEWYCPLSVVRVFGLNEMEEWKRDVWEREAREAEAREREAVLARVREEREAQETRSVEVVRVETVVEKRPATLDSAVTVASPTASATERPADPVQPTTTTSSVDTSPTPASAAEDFSFVTASTISQSDATPEPTTEAGNGTQECGPATPSGTIASLSVSPSPETATSSNHEPAAAEATSMADEASARREEPTPLTSTSAEEVASTTSGTTEASPSVQTTSFVSVPLSVQTSSVPPDTPLSFSSSTPLTTPSQPLASPSSPQSQSQSQPPHTLSLSPPPPPPPTSSPPPAPSPSSSSSGTESIYRTIMNRLSLLEQNTTLGTRYMEEQSRMMREAFRKLERGVEERVKGRVGGWEGEWRGMLEGLSKEQREALQNALEMLETQRAQIDAERASLLTQLHMLENEVTLEKRLSVAQLCLLLVVLVLLALTRGPDWGAISSALRPLSSHSTHAYSEVEVVDLGRRTPERRHSGLWPASPGKQSARLAVPQSSPRPSRPTSAASVPLPTRGATQPAGAAAGTHTPTRRRVTGGPLSAGKRLARTAHLHEMRRAEREEDARGRERRRSVLVEGDVPSGDMSRTDGKEGEDGWEDTDLDGEGQVARAGVEGVGVRLGTPPIMRRRVALREVPGNIEVVS